MSELPRIKTGNKRSISISSASSSHSSVSTTKEKPNVKKSYLDLSNLSKVEYSKQNSINNTNEVFDFFTSITNNQKDLNKKYEHLFSLIKKYGKDIKYLFSKNDEHNNLLTDTNGYTRKIKEHLQDTSYKQVEQIESKLHKDNNNIDIVTRLLIHILEEIEKCHFDFSKCSKGLKELTENFENISNKIDYSNFEKKMTMENEKLKKEFTSNINKLIEEQTINIQTQGTMLNYRKDIKLIYTKFLHSHYQFFIYIKNYKKKKFLFSFWFHTIKNKKKGINRIISYIRKKKKYFLFYGFKQLKKNCYEISLIEKVLTLVNCQDNISNTVNNNRSSKSNVQIYPSNTNVRNVEPKLSYAKLENIYNTKKKMSTLNNLNSYNYNYNYNSNKIERNENSFLYLNSNNIIKNIETKKEPSNNYYGSIDSNNREEDATTVTTSVVATAEREKEKEKEREREREGIGMGVGIGIGVGETETETETLNSYPYTFRESSNSLKTYMDKYIQQINSKADKKVVDALYQSIKKLNYKLNEIKNVIDIQKKINEELIKPDFNDRKDSLYYNYKKNSIHNTNTVIEKNRRDTLFDEKRKNSILEMNRISTYYGEPERTDTISNKKKKSSVYNTANRTLSEFMLNHQPSKKASLTSNSHVKSLLKRRDEENERKKKNEKNLENNLQNNLQNNLENNLQNNLEKNRESKNYEPFFRNEDMNQRSSKYDYRYKTEVPQTQNIEEFMSKKFHENFEKMKSDITNFSKKNSTTDSTNNYNAPHPYDEKRSKDAGSFYIKEDIREKRKKSIRPPDDGRNDTVDQVNRTDRNYRNYRTYRTNPIDPIRSADSTRSTKRTDSNDQTYTTDRIDQTNRTDRIDQTDQTDQTDRIHMKNRDDNIDKVDTTDRHIRKYNKRETIDESEDTATVSNINVVLRTGGGFRKLSEQDKNHFIQKANYLQGNNLLGYATNFNIKIKAAGFLDNIPNSYQNAFKKERRHRSLSAFHNMH